MSNEIICGVQLVEVHMLDYKIGDRPVVQLWVAALQRDKAEAAVQNAVPPTWKAKLSDRRLTQVQIEHLKLRPGEVREMTS